MIQEIKGNIIETDCTLIAHGCNCQGVMGSGVAKAIINRWPQVKQNYLNYFQECLECTPSDFLGCTQFNDIEDKIIANCFTQQNYGYDKQVYLNYEALKSCLESILYKCSKLNITEIAMPKIGCGLAGGDWNKVKLMIEEIFKDSGITVKVYYLED